MPSLNAHERRRLEALIRQRKIDGISCEMLEKALRVLVLVDSWHRRSA